MNQDDINRSKLISILILVLLSCLFAFSPKFGNAEVDHDQPLLPPHNHDDPNIVKPQSPQSSSSGSRSGSGSGSGSHLAILTNPYVFVFVILVCVGLWTQREQYHSLARDHLVLRGDLRENAVENRVRAEYLRENQHRHEGQLNQQIAINRQFAGNQALLNERIGNVRDNLADHRQRMDAAIEWQGRLNDAASREMARIGESTRRLRIDQDHHRERTDRFERAQIGFNRAIDGQWREANAAIMHQARAIEDNRRDAENRPQEQGPCVIS